MNSTVSCPFYWQHNHFPPCRSHLLCYLSRTLQLSRLEEATSNPHILNIVSSPRSPNFIYRLPERQDGYSCRMKWTFLPPLPASSYCCERCCRFSNLGGTWSLPKITTASNFGCFLSLFFKIAPRIAYYTSRPPSRRETTTFRYKSWKLATSSDSGERINGIRTREERKSCRRHVVRSAKRIRRIPGRNASSD